MSEKLKSLDEHMQELRKEFRKLQDEEIAKIGRGEEADSDLLAFRSEWVDALGATELEALHKVLMLRRGSKGGYAFEKDEIKNAFLAVVDLRRFVEQRIQTFWKEQKRNGSPEMTRENFMKQDYVALYSRLIDRQLSKFVDDNPGYTETLKVIRAEVMGAAK